MAMAQSWESAKDLPPEIYELLSPLFPDVKLLIALPEHKVPLPGSNLGASQNDVFALLRSKDRTIAMTVEGKVDEPFDSPLGKWLKNASVGKRRRLAYLCEMLRLREQPPDDVYYQLLHRAASALIEAERFKTDAAAMIVHSFSLDDRWFFAFQRFVSLLGIENVEIGKLVRIDLEPRPIFLGWAKGDPKFREDLGRACALT